MTDEFLDLANMLAETDPSDSAALAELEGRLDCSAAAIQHKGSAIAALIREFEAQAEVARAEAERIASHARAAQSRAIWLREYLLRNLEQLGIDRIQTATSVVTVRSSPPSVRILDELAIPESYKQRVTTLDKAMLRRALVNHDEVPGACLVHGRHLVIR